MKANRNAIYNDEEAVSPVIAVILMVAITVVLAATVFVLVNELGQNVGETGPNLGLATINAETDSDNWALRLTTATSSAPIGEYTFILSTPSGAGGTCTNSNVTAAQDELFGTTALCNAYTLGFTDIDADGNLDVSDRLSITRSSDFATGTYAVEISHRPSGTSAGTLSREF